MCKYNFYQLIEIAHPTHGNACDLIEFLNKFMTITPIEKLMHGGDPLVVCTLYLLGRPETRGIANMLIENATNKVIIRKYYRRYFIGAITEHIEYYKK